MHYIKKLQALIIMALTCASMAISCSTPDNIKSVPAATFKNDIQSQDAQIVDVRTADEYNEGHIHDAVNIDVNSDDFISQATTSLKKEQTVYVYCKSGKRSRKAAGMLIEEGYTVVNLNGGITEWQDNGLPVCKE